MQVPLWAHGPSQVVGDVNEAGNASWRDISLLALPLDLAALSLLVLLGQVAHSFVVSGKRSPPHLVLRARSTSRFLSHVNKLGGSTIFVFRIVRLVACLFLVGLCFWTSSLRSGGKATFVSYGLDPFGRGLCFVYVYACVLALVSIITSSKWGRACSTHLTAVLLVPWALFMYRDIWPLATFTLSPVDSHEGWVLWAKIAVLTFAAVLIPLTQPYQYTAINPEDVAEPAPADTASVLSLMFHTYCDPIVYKANRVPHLKLDELPPLSDTMFTKNLVTKSYKHLDTMQAKRRHLAFNLIFKVFGAEHAEIGLLLILKVVAAMFAPLGINRLLNYMETGGQGAMVRPWVWVCWLLLGPAVKSIAHERSFYLSNQVFVQAQSIITQLIFDHAMRMRVKSDTPMTQAAPPSGPDGTGRSTPDLIANVGQSGDSSPRISATSHISSIAPSVSTSSTQTSLPGKGAGSNSRPDTEKSSNLVGKLNNLVTTDLNLLQNGQAFIGIFIQIPAQISLCVVALYSMLGWSVFLGLGTMLLLSPAPGSFAKRLSHLQEDKMEKSDARVQSVTETMNMIRMVKLFGWESRMSAQIAEKRETELKAVRNVKFVELFNSIFSNAIPVATMIMTYGTYTLIMGGTLTASKVFSSIAMFEIIQDQFVDSFWYIVPVIQAKVSLDRINEFLKTTELLDEFTPRSHVATAPEAEVDDDRIGIQASSFTWTTDRDGTATPGSNQRQFVLKIDDGLFFKRGGFNLVIGQTGSGKTSLLMSLLGEMHYIPTGPDSVVRLPRTGGVAYHAQESWVLNDTIRNNILFGTSYDERRYNTVIEHCGLKPDLALFSAGDQTEVGEKGLTLSGGQKARVTLARAVYSPAEILLLDDVLAALDVHTAKWIVEKCFQGELLRSRTVILVTHNIALAAPLAEFVVLLSPDGRVSSQGSLSSALAKDRRLQAEVTKEQQTMKGIEHGPKRLTREASEPPKKKNGQLVVEEEITLGSIGWSALKLFFSSMRGTFGPFIFWATFVTFMVVSKAALQLNVWILGQWAKAYETQAPSEVSVTFYLSLYSIVVLVFFLAFGGTYMTWVIGSIRASRRLHQRLTESVLGATLRWLDKTPIARVITRCTQDIASIDGIFAEILYFTIDTALQISMRFITVIALSPIFSIPGLVILFMGFAFGHVYMRAQLPMKRESSNAKSPVLGHFNSAVSGLVSIRAYGAQDAFRKELRARLDRYSRAQVPYWNLDRWVGIRSNVLAGTFAASLAAYLIYGGGGDASTTGFSLTMAVSVSRMILWFVRRLNLAQVEGNSVERIQQYLQIDQEPKDTKQGEPPAYWPASGDLRVEGLSARYSQDGPNVLHDLNFHIRSGERVGIVGRTGSGKSSLTLALLRCIITEGTIYYDGLPTGSVNLSSLRSSITIIPQVPELLSGTLRQNLDPFSQHDDAELNDALRSAGLFSLQTESNESRLTLDTAISGGGNNLSVGQRQIIALARAIVRQSKLLILDEATSAIDYATDSIIQTSLRTKLDKDVTLITVAHRLQTIMDADRIMVLDKGHIVEFDKPCELLRREKGFLRALVDESGDKEKLCAMATKVIHL